MVVNLTFSSMSILSPALHALSCMHGTTSAYRLPAALVEGFESLWVLIKNRILDCTSVGVTIYRPAATEANCNTISQVTSVDVE